MSESLKKGATRADEGAKSSNINLLDAATAILGQLPGGLTALGYDRFSIYQPTFYRGKELFLLIPMLVGFFATWFIMRNHRAMTFIFVIAFITGVVNYSIFEFVSLQNGVHAVNWLLSYCTFALFVAVAMRFLAEMLGLKAKA